MPESVTGARMTFVYRECNIIADILAKICSGVRFEPVDSSTNTPFRPSLAIEIFVLIG